MLILETMREQITEKEKRMRENMLVSPRGEDTTEREGIDHFCYRQSGK